MILTAVSKSDVALGEETLPEQDDILLDETGDSDMMTVDDTVETGCDAANGESVKELPNGQEAESDSLQTEQTAVAEDELTVDEGKPIDTDDKPLMAEVKSDVTEEEPSEVTQDGAADIEENVKVTDNSSVVSEEKSLENQDEPMITEDAVDDSKAGDVIAADATADRGVDIGANLEDTPGMEEESAEQATNGAETGKPEAASSEDTKGCHDIAFL